MQETPGAQSGWERGASGQEQVRVSPKQGGPLPSPAVSSSSISPMMKGPSHTCRLSQWDSIGETSWWRSWQGLCEAATRPCTHMSHPQQNFTPSSPPVAGTEPGSPPPANQAVVWPGRRLCCSAGLPCRRSAGHLSAASLPPPSEAAALFEGRNGVTPTLSPPDNRGQHITRVLISPGPEAPCRSQTNMQTRASAPAFMMWAQIPPPNLNQSIGGREWPISHRHCLVHIHILSWEGLLAGML